MINIYPGVALHDVLWHSLPLIGGVVYLLLSIPQTREAWSRDRALRSAATT